MIVVSTTWYQNGIREADCRKVYHPSITERDERTKKAKHRKKSERRRAKKKQEGSEI